MFFYLEISHEFPIFNILEKMCSYVNYKQSQYHIYNIVFVLCLKRNCDSFDRNVCGKSEMYTTACKVDFMTKLYIGKGLVLAIVSNKHVFKIKTMKWKLDILTWIILLFINLMFCNCNIHLYLLSFSLFMNQMLE